MPEWFGVVVTVAIVAFFAGMLVQQARDSDVVREYRRWRASLGDGETAHDIRAPWW